MQAEDALKFRTNDDGKPKNIPHNWRVAMQKLGVRVRRDLFNDRMQLSGLPDFGPVCNDAAIVRLRFIFAERFGFQIAKDTLHDFVSDEAEKNRFHPVRDYLDGLHWDGIPRIEALLPRYFRTEDNAYIRAVGRLFMIAAVRRVRSPGCKFDEMVVLKSEQGTGKSTALKVLAVDEEWFADELPLGSDGKRVIEATSGKWIVEAAEMVKTTKSADQLKASLSRSTDRARMSYARIPVEKPREFVVIGTINEDRYLVDKTGNRRFWPVDVGDIDLEALERDRDQLWAEAAAMEAQGESIRLHSSLWAFAEAEQKKREIENPLEAIFEQKLGEWTGRIPIGAMYDLLGIQKGDQSLTTLMGQAAQATGWKRKQVKHCGAQKRCYVRGDNLSSQRQLDVRRSRDGVWYVYEVAEENEPSPF